VVGKRAFVVCDHVDGTGARLVRADACGSEWTLKVVSNREGLVVFEIDGTLTPPGFAEDDLLASPLKEGDEGSLVTVGANLPWRTVGATARLRLKQPLQAQPATNLVGRALCVGQRLLGLVSEVEDDWDLKVIPAHALRRRIKQIECHVEAHLTPSWYRLVPLRLALFEHREYERLLSSLQESSDRPSSVLDFEHTAWMDATTSRIVFLPFVAAVVFCSWKRSSQSAGSRSRLARSEDAGSLRTYCSRPDARHAIIPQAKWSMAT
jgi:hypothetical protein